MRQQKVFNTFGIGYWRQLERDRRICHARIKRDARVGKAYAIRSLIRNRQASSCAARKVTITKVKLKCLEA